MQPIVLYNLSSLTRPNEQWSFNPYKTHYTLVLKNLPFTTKWLEFHEVSEVIPNITKTDARPSVPVIIDSNNTVVQDSWKIAKYLETTYPDSPSIFNGAESLHYFFYQYYETNIKRYIFSLSVLDVKEMCGHYDNPKGFTRTLEGVLGVSLDTFAKKKEDNIKILQEKLTIIRNTLSSYTFLTGDKIGWADLTLVGGLHMVEFFDKKAIDTYVFTGEDDVLRKYYYRVKDELNVLEKGLEVKA
ncbi:hypothetical protein BDF14DRAFT_1853070 [Spinellus fusiger]|nr:hypothetical protein BDF14DRAFT_1853070 [Spinellus fusiger]